MTRPIALVTGASSGIGTALAKELARAGYDLVLVARRRERLGALAAELALEGASSEILPVDLSERDGIRRAADRAAAGDIDVVVSNAGISAYGPLADLDTDTVDRAWTLNADATPFLVRAALPGMLGRDRGGFITVASNLAFSASIPSLATPDRPFSMPARTLYVGAKAGTVAFTRTLAAELASTGVHATVVCPGLVSSEWNSGASQANPMAMSPEDVASAAWASFTSGEIVCLPGAEHTDALDQLAVAEQAVMRSNAGPALASRYRG